MMRKALAENNIAHGSRAKAAELLRLYNTVPLAERQKFEQENQIDVTDGQPNMDNITDGDLSDDLEENDSTNGTDLTENHANVVVEQQAPLAAAVSKDPLDCELEKLRKQHEIMLLREKIEEMKERAAIRAVAEAAENSVPIGAAAENAVSPSAAVVENVCETVASRSVTLPTGLRTTPTAAAALPNNHRRVQFTDLEKSIVKFTGEDPTIDVRNFLAQFEDLMRLVEANELYKLLGLRRSLDGAAKLLLHTNDVPTYEALKEALVTEFGNQMTPNDIEMAMRNRKWNRVGGEGMHRYILEMEAYIRQMGRERLTEQQAVDIIVANMQMPSDEANCYSRINTISELKQTLQRYKGRIEAACAAASKGASRANEGPGGRAGPQRGNNANSQANQRAPQRNAGNNAAANPNDEVRCYNCSRRGHYKGDCPYEVRPSNVCFNCWKPGHIHNNCKGQKYAQKLMTEVSAVQDDRATVG